jgi:hypothetical protein
MCLRRDVGERWTCEQLLCHPFLAAGAHDDDDIGEPSPRAVLDWAATTDSDSDASSTCSEGDMDDGVEARPLRRRPRNRSNTSRASSRAPCVGRRLKNRCSPCQKYPNQFSSGLCPEGLQRMEML